MFPAPAGMSPYGLIYTYDGNNVPRTRGDEPAITVSVVKDEACSPHPRG